VRELALLPGIVESLSEARERAKREKDSSLSQAVKIIMNSFYGVLGNPTCRFHRPELAGAITLSGQWILLESKAFLEKAGYKVIYGDTDSLFLHVGEGGAPGSSAGPVAGADKASQVEALRALGAALVERLNRHLQETLRERFGVESRLTMEFEKVFLRFFMPSLRKEERGSKKRYAGLLVAGAGQKGSDGHGKSLGGGPETVLHFAGLESARSDWTQLAKDFQAELLNLVFRREDGDPLGPVEDLVRKWNRRLFAGEMDDRLEYRKGLSKGVEEYGDSAPPHVRAARMLDKPGRVIRYVMTVEGPEPIQRRTSARPDYRHYAEKQLAPIADMVLRFMGTDFASLTDEARQMSIL
jgi:DNA polymerase-2